MAPPRIEPLRPRFAPPVLPRAYKRIDCDDTQFVEEHALMIFTELSNAGQPLSKILSAIFLTGMHYAIELTKEQPCDQP